MILSIISGSKQDLLPFTISPDVENTIVICSPGNCIYLAHPHVWILVVGVACLHAHHFFSIHQFIRTLTVYNEHGRSCKHAELLNIL